MNDKTHRQFMHNWHVSINRHATIQRELGRPWPSYMYEGKSAAGELPRLIKLFALERTGQLPKIHRQCSRSQHEQIENNHLTCGLGMKCKECPELMALDSIKDATPDDIDTAKAWTCVAHILENARNCDTSEGYILRVDDRMFWDRVYANLSADDDQ